MNKLLSILSNVTYIKKVKKEDGIDEYVKLTEIILLCNKPTYEIINEDTFEFERKDKEVEQFRFMVSEETLESLIKKLQEIKGAKD